MRLVIDLLSCQNGAARAPAAAVALAQALVRRAAGHRVIVTLSAAHPDQIDTLRHAFAGLLPAGDVRCYASPGGADAWSRRAAGLIRDGYLAALEADAILAPGLCDQPWHDELCGPGPDGVAMLYSVADAGVLQAPAAPAQRPAVERQQRALRGAALVLTADAAQAQPLRGLLAPAAVLACGAEPDAAAALLWRALEEGQAARAAAAEDGARAGAAARPRLAYISPLPPQQSGIADYSAELVAELAPHYEIELVCDHDGAVDAGLAARFPLRSPAYFEEHAAGYQRVLYHFGNSNAHQYMFGLLRRHPGVVVLHDFYLSGVLDNMERDEVEPQAFLAALYASHGYGALLAHAEQGRNPAIWAYPCNKEVLERASGVIVHGEFSRRLAEQWYGAGSAADWRCLPLLRGLADPRPAAERRAAARAALGLDDDDFLVCSFGMLGATKLNHRLLDAFLATPLARQRRCRLVFVGAHDAGPYGIALQRRIDAGGANVNITGFASGADYARYLAASDVAVQLRAQTRGETSASVLDCLLHGVPTIINAHGAAADLPDTVLLKLADAFDDADLAAALERLHGQPARRAALAEAGREHVRRHHAPAAVGRQYVAAIEHFARHSPAGHYARLLRGLRGIDTPRPPAAAALVGAATAVAANLAAAPPRQLLVDVSALVQTDPRTGIQRVVRSILLALIKDAPAGYRVETVYSDGGNRSYRYARRFTFAMLGGAAPQLEDAPIETRPGDLFLGLDLATNITSQNQAQLEQWRQRGVGLWFVLYDLLPLLRPDDFPHGAEKYYGDYIRTITACADGIVSISRAVSDQLAHWLESHPSRRRTPLQLGCFHLGADIDASAPSTGLPANAERVRAALGEAPTLLMVGTLEPRKGQAQALDACELLWQQGVAVNLVIVGRNGWLVDALARRLQHHPQRELRLFWLEGVSDQMLLQLYASSSALLAASEGEGFGLPLIEAAQHGLPIIARDLPVFREVAGDHAYYFSGSGAAPLARAIGDWLALRAAGAAPPSTGMPWLSWQESAQRLLDVVVRGASHARYAPDGVAPQLLVDVSAMVRADLRTGIQRVVRAQLTALLRLPTTEFRAHAVYLSDAGGHWHYRYASCYEYALLGTEASGVVDAPLRVAAGDVFYCPDFFPAATIEAGRLGIYQRWRAAGVGVNFLIHDVLPLQRPDRFPEGAAAQFGRWLDTVAAQADRLVCISAAVAGDTRAQLAARAPARPLPAFAVLHHGADIDASQPSGGLPDDAAALLRRLAAAPAFLMVGTLEPRKGHLQALSAFEQLWADGVEAQLVVVGAPGWQGLPDGARRTIPALEARLRGHAELGRRLHWLQGVSDEYLERLYAASACLLAPSEGEGFGLPLIEAARHGLPVLARALPVFREVAGRHAHYFSGDDGAALAAALRDWLRLDAAGQAPGSAGMPRLTWADNARQLSRLLFAPPPISGIQA